MSYEAKSVTDEKMFGALRVNLVIRRIALECEARQIDLYKIFSYIDKDLTYRLDEAQWDAALSMINIPHSLMNEIDKEVLTKNFKSVDGTINYLAFCKAIECVNNYKTKSITQSKVIENIKPIKIPEYTLSGLLPIDIEEESVFYDLMMKIASICYTNGYNMLSYSKEIEQSSQYDSGRITVENFSKILFKADIKLKPIEFSVIVRKFIDFNYLINFKLFCECIASLEPSTIPYYGFLMVADILNTAKDKTQRCDVYNTKGATSFEYNPSDHPLTRFRHDENVKTLIYRLQGYVYRYSIRDFISYFKEKDLYNVGQISIDAFKNVLSRIGIGIGVLGNLTLTENEVNKLIEFYSDNNEKIIWKEFYRDINSVWGTEIGEGEKTPETMLGWKLGPMVGFQSINERGLKFNEMKLKDRIECENLMSKTIYEKINDLIVSPIMYQYDRGRNSHVPLLNFRTAMDRAGKIFSNREIELLEGKYYDAHGFNYRKYLDNVRSVNEKKDPMKRMWGKNYCGVDGDISLKTVSEDEKLPSLFDVMNRIRHQVQIRNVDLWQFFRQYIRTVVHYTMHKDAFNAALSTAGIILEKNDVKVLFKTYSSNGERIDYKKFYDNLNRFNLNEKLFNEIKILPPEYIDYSIFEKPLKECELINLEKAFDISAYYADYGAMEKLDYIKKKSMDYHAFIRALTMIQVKDMLTNEQQSLMFKAFSRPVGSNYAINFDDFIRHLERIKLARKDYPDRHYTLYQNPDTFKNELVPAKTKPQIC